MDGPARDIFLKDLAAKLIHLLSDLAHFFFAEKNRQILIAAFPDLFAEFLERKFLSEMPERFLPRLHMEVVRIDERSVEIENRGADHLVGRRSAEPQDAATILSARQSLALPEPRLLTFLSRCRHVFFRRGLLLRHCRRLQLMRQLHLAFLPGLVASLRLCARRQLQQFHSASDHFHVVA